MNLYCELDILDDLVLNKLNPLNPSESSSERLEEWLKLAHTENFKIRTKLLDDILHQPDEAHITVFIHSLQKQLTILANELFYYVGEDYIFLDNYIEEKLTFRNSQRITYYIIEHLLSFIQNNFEEFFNVDENPTRRVVIVAKLEFIKKIEELKKLAIEPNKFLNVVIPTIQDFVNRPEKVTFRRLYYMEYLIDEILSFKNQSQYSDLTIFIIVKLVYLNFNSDRFFSTITQESLLVISQLENHNAKIEKLSWYMKVMNQAQVHLDFSYHPNRPPIKIQLSNWIKEEILYIEKKIELTTVEDPGSNYANGNIFKIITDLSVPQLTYLFNLFIEIGVIKNKKTKSLFEFISQHFQTKKTENLSPKGLSTNFYNVETNAREVVKDIIFRILNYINSHPLFFFLSVLHNIICDYLIDNNIIWELL